jgi:hypothetical protein
LYNKHVRFGSVFKKEERNFRERVIKAQENHQAHLTPKELNSENGFPNTTSVFTDPENEMQTLYSWILMWSSRFS